MRRISGSTARARAIFTRFRLPRDTFLFSSQKRRKPDKPDEFQRTPFSDLARRSNDIGADEDIRCTLRLFLLLREYKPAVSAGCAHLPAINGHLTPSWRF